MTDGDILSILPNLQPFESEATDDPLFDITLDNSIQPSWRGSRVGTFPCPSAKFEVYLLDNGAYQILTSNEYGHPCAFMQSDAGRKHFTVTTRGCESDRTFGFNNTLMVIFTMCTAKLGTLLMHSATVENNGKGYMFLGASGQGKSTHSNKWVEYIKGSTLINDDNPVIRIAPDGTPHSATISKSSGNIHMDAEALRVAELMPKWQPAAESDDPQGIDYVIYVNFRPGR